MTPPFETGRSAARGVRRLSMCNTGLFPQFFRMVWLVVFCGVLTVASAQKGPVRRNPRPDPASAQAAEAIHDLFVRSELDGARRAAQASIALSAPSATRANRISRLDALFVEMEAASLQADTSTELDAALRLCELRGSDTDPRVSIAAARILDLAANTAEFRTIVPRIVTLLSNGSAQANYLRPALLAAAADGMSGLSELNLARDSGLITDWRLVGPFGSYPAIAFDEVWPPEQDNFSRNDYGARIAETFRFHDGTFTLPDYFDTSGVLYASAEVTLPVAGEWRLRVESAGTLDLFLDGVRVLTKDDRFRVTPETVWKPVRLASGKHRVVVKFMAAAAPFRIGLLKSNDQMNVTIGAPASPALSAYINAARDYWLGDYAAAIEQLNQLRHTQESAAVDVLLAEAWEREGSPSAERVPLLRAALKLAPSALAAKFRLAQKALDDDHPEEALRRGRDIVRLRPGYEPAVHLVASAAARLDLQPEAAQAYDSAVSLHPSCSVLRDASKFFASISDYVRARDFESRLGTCAPRSLALAHALAEAGRHSEAAAFAENIITREPHDRGARELMVHELASAGQMQRARDVARELLAISPNSAEFRVLAQSLDSGGSITRPDESRQPGFAEIRQFYAPYRRNSLAIVQQTSQRRFAGGPAVTLLNDRVAQLRPDGTAALYVHKMTRVLDRDGILQFGEVALPQGASILELKTIKADGSIAEPEFTQHKATVSMPALAPGDVIDVEYVIRYPEGGLRDHQDAFQFTFGSFAAPLIYSRFVVISPADARLQLDPSGDIPTVRVQEDERSVIRIWERNDIAQSPTEVSMPRAGVLPTMRVLPAANGWADVRDFYREALVNAARVGTRTASLAREIRGDTDELRLRAAYRIVTSRVRPAPFAYSAGEFPSAEATLANYSGSRTVALLALAEAMGIRSDLLMTRDLGMPRPTAITPQAYSRPLIVFHIRSGQTARDIVVDAENDGLGFGGISPAIARTDAMLVPLRAGRGNESLIAAVPQSLLEDHSIAEGDVTIDDDGDLTASVLIRMGAGRSAQMRSILGGIAPEGRQHFFEQLAMRIFPGASEASGEIHNESDPDHQLELTVSCRAPRFINFRQSVADLDQLVPALGLRKLYFAAGPRRAPLYIDTPLIETATFHVHLTGTGRFASIPTGVVERSEYGEYSVAFNQLAPNTIDIRRDFRIPVQVIAAGRFEDFSRFARRIDDAERQRLSVERAAPTASAH